MTILLITYDLTLPLTNPVLKFFLILVIILFAPIIFNKLRIPYLLGLIIAGAIVGPNGFNLMVRDSSIILSGTAGLLYIMFLAGLEIDLREFRNNKGSSLFFGLLTFSIPMLLGSVAGKWVLNLPTITAILLASMFASHTLLAYPIVSKFGITKNRAVTVALGGTMITDTLALLVLAVIVASVQGEVTSLFWIERVVGLIILGAILIFLFPVIARWFFKTFSDEISHYVFVLLLLFLAAVLSELAGVEGIIGAFFAGLSLNKLIPRTSPLMNRIDFIGNAIFIPFFLIGVGMLIDYRIIFSGTETLVVASVMTFIATTAKYLASWVSQKALGFSDAERNILFGLSNAQAAATLAAVTIGYNIILGYDSDGLPIRLLTDSILNGTIIMILITCTIASFSAQKGVLSIALTESAGIDERIRDANESILISVSNPETAVELAKLSLIIKSRDNTTGLHALSILCGPGNNPSDEKKAARVLEKVVATAAATDTIINPMIRYDMSVTNGISGVIKEKQVTDLILGLHHKKDLSESYLGNLTEGILSKCNATTLIYKPVQPISTIKRHLVLLPVDADREPGFPFWLVKVWNISRNTGTQIVFYGSERVLKLIRQVDKKHPVGAGFVLLEDWNTFLKAGNNIQDNESLIIVLSRKGRPSYNPIMNRIPYYLNNHNKALNFILVYPMQSGVAGFGEVDYNNPSLMRNIEGLDEIGATLAGIFERKAN